MNKACGAEPPRAARERVDKSLAKDASGVAPGPGRLRRAVTIALAGLAVALGAGAIAWLAVIPNPRGLRDRNPTRTAVMEQRLSEAREAGRPLRIHQQWVPLDAISPQLVRAVIVAEDYRFRQHHGVDWVSLADEVRWTGHDSFSWRSPSDLKALMQAVAYGWRHRDGIRGRSTITQQLAKNLYFSTDRSLVRKVVEFVVAGRLERELGKDRILELYLNVAEWGPGIFGVEAASQAYFGHSASSLSLDEAAALAGTLPQPLTSNPAQNPGRMTWRKNLILARLSPPPPVPTSPMPLAEPDLEMDTGVPPPEPLLLAPLVAAPSDSGVPVADPHP
jgi:monofunctional glycosyltransferase